MFRENRRNDRCPLLDSVRFSTLIFHFSLMIWVKFSADQFFIIPLAVINFMYFVQ